MDADTSELLRKRHPLKLGKVHTADSMVVKKVTCPHELMYTAAGQPAVYEDLSMIVVVSGYLAVMETVMHAWKPIMAKHPMELMADEEVYGWVLVRVYHMVWFQQIENG